MLFSDKSTMQQFIPRKRHDRRPVGNRCDEKFTTATMKHPPTQTIWRAMSCFSYSGLHFILPSHMYGHRYVELLNETLKLHMDIHTCTIFMHDGSSCHRFKVATDFPKKNKIAVLEWHGNCPDLRSNENMWTIIKDTVTE